MTKADSDNPVAIRQRAGLSHALATLVFAMAVASTDVVADTMTHYGTGFAIPDNNSAGGSSSIVVTDTGTLTDVYVTLRFQPEHTWAGDLIATLSRTGTDGTQSIQLFNRVVKSSAVAGFGDSSNLNGTYTFSDAGSDFNAAARAVGNNASIANSTYRSSTNIFNGNAATTNPFTSFGSTFGGRDRSGTWTLSISDNAGFDTGSLADWSLSTTSVSTPEPSTFGILGILCAGFALRTWRRRGADRAADTAPE